MVYKNRRKSIFMRDLNGDNNGIIIDKSTSYYLENSKEKVEDTKIEKKESSLKAIIKEKVIEVIVGAVLSGVASILIACQKNGVFDSTDTGMYIWIVCAILVGFVLGGGLLLIFVYDMFKVWKLSRKGAFVEMESKIEWLNIFLNFFRNSENASSRETRTVGRCYKNIEGKIYIIQKKKCPICESEPIGNMSLRYSITTQTYFWECSQYHGHTWDFDYKKNI